MSTPTSWNEAVDEILRLVFEAGYLDGSKPEDYRERLTNVMQIKQAKSALNKAVKEIVIKPDVEVSDAAKLHTIGLDGKDGFTRCNCGADYSGTYRIIHNNELKAEQRKIIGDK